MRRLIGDDAKHLTTALKALALSSTEIAHSVPSLGCLIAPSLARRLSLCVEAITEQVHPHFKTTRLSNATSMQWASHCLSFLITIQLMS